MGRVETTRPPIPAAAPLVGCVMGDDIDTSVSGSWDVGVP